MVPWYRCRTAITCSTGWSSAKPVNPRRSANITVAHRRTGRIESSPSPRSRIRAASGSRGRRGEDAGDGVADPVLFEVGEPLPVQPGGDPGSEDHGIERLREEVVGA